MLHCGQLVGQHGLFFYDRVRKNVVVASGCFADPLLTPEPCNDDVAKAEWLQGGTGVVLVIMQKMKTASFGGDAIA